MLECRRQRSRRYLVLECDCELTREFEKPVLLNMIAARTPPIAIVLSASFLVSVFAACGSGGASSPGSDPETITAQVCTDGEARDTRLYVRNLDDFEWMDLEVSVSKGGETYSQELASLLPESQAIAPPFSNSGDFSIKGKRPSTLPLPSLVMIPYSFITDLFHKRLPFNISTKLFFSN